MCISPYFFWGKVERDGKLNVLVFLLLDTLWLFFLLFTAQLNFFLDAKAKFQNSLKSGFLNNSIPHEPVKVPPFRFVHHRFPQMKKVSTNKQLNNLFFCFTKARYGLFAAVTLKLMAPLSGHI